MNELINKPQGRLVLLVYPGTPPLESFDISRKHTKSTAKLVDAFMDLFLANGFVLDEKSPQYRDDVLEFGDVAKMQLISFFGEHNIKPAEHKTSSSPCASCTKLVI